MVTAFEVVVVISFFAIAILPVQIMGATLKSTGLQDDVIGARRKGGRYDDVGECGGS